MRDRVPDGTSQDQRPAGRELRTRRRDVRGVLAWQHAAATYTAVNTQVSVVVHDLKQFVIGAFGTTSPKLADFGFVPRTVTPLTVEQKAAAAAKRAATRKARGTTGPKAKLAITGTVPATASATTAPATTPASASSSAAPTTTQATPSPAPAAGPTAAPGQAPTVTVNVTTAPAATTQTTQGSEAAASPAATTPPATGAPAAAKS